MNSYFRRQLTDYVEYHRDPWNCAMHVIGIVFLFLAAVLPLSSWSVAAFGVQTSAATIAVVPVLIYWFLLDAALGTAILGAAVLLLSAAAMIVNYTTSAGMWSITVVLIVIGVASQVVGHRVFERRQPALMDNPTHLLLGPMFVMAKLFIALGFRRDLAVVIQQVPQTAPRSSSLYAEKRQAEPRPHALYGHLSLAEAASSDSTWFRRSSRAIDRCGFSILSRRPAPCRKCSMSKVRCSILV
jgi:uncharacterized membrane protein YGL010W